MEECWDFFASKAELSEDPTDRKTWPKGKPSTHFVNIYNQWSSIAKKSSKAQFVELLVNPKDMPPLKLTAKEMEFLRGGGGGMFEGVNSLAVAIHFSGFDYACIKYLNGSATVVAAGISTLDDDSSSPEEMKEEKSSTGEDPDSPTDPLASVKTIYEPGSG